MPVPLKAVRSESFNHCFVVLAIEAAHKLVNSLLVGGIGGLYEYCIPGDLIVLQDNYIKPSYGEILSKNI